MSTQPPDVTLQRPPLADQSDSDQTIPDSPGSSFVASLDPDVPASPRPCSPPWRVVIVDDDPMVCRALREILALDDAIEVIGVAHSGDAAISVVHSTRPDVVLMDIVMPGTDGIEATRCIARLPGAPRVVLLTSVMASDAAERALAVGAAGFIYKDHDPDALGDAIRLAAQGIAPFSPRGLTELAATPPANAPAVQAQRQIARLTVTERIVVEHVAADLTNLQIAEQMFVSERTVKKHVSSAMVKLNCATRVGLAVIMTRATGRG